MIQPTGSIQNTASVQAIRATTMRPDVDAAATAKSAAQSPEISEQGKILAQSDTVYQMDMGSGKRHVDLDTYFSTQGVGETHSLHDIEDLLIPSSANVKALQQHISSVFPEFLSNNGIPEAPDSINYDNLGHIVLPDDYAYADELKQALTDNPAMEHTLRTTNALASHAAALQQLQPFHNAFAEANSDAARDAVIAKYSHLLADNRSYPDISLQFNQDGALTVTADGKAMV